MRNKIFGSTAVDNICANSILANYLKIDPKFVTVPVIGGSSEGTRVPILSLAKPNCYIPDEVQQQIIKNIKRRDLNIFEAKGCRDSIDKAYGNVRFLTSVLSGLRGDPNIVDFAMTKTDMVNGLEFFSLPVLLGKKGISKRFSIPQINKTEEAMLSKAAIVLRKEFNKASLYFRNKRLEPMKDTSINCFDKPLHFRVNDKSTENTIPENERNTNSFSNRLMQIFGNSRKTAKGNIKEKNNTSSDIFDNSLEALTNMGNKKKSSVSDVDSLVYSPYEIPSKEKSMYGNKKETNTYQETSINPNNLQKIWNNEILDNHYPRNSENFSFKKKSSGIPNERLNGEGMETITTEPGQSTTHSHKLKDFSISRITEFCKSLDYKRSIFSIKDISTNQAVAVSKGVPMLEPLTKNTYTVAIPRKQSNNQSEYLERFKQRRMLERENCVAEAGTSARKAVGNLQPSESSEPTVKFYSTNSLKNKLKPCFMKETSSSCDFIKNKLDSKNQNALAKDSKKLDVLATNGIKKEMVQDNVNKSGDEPNIAKEKATLSCIQDENKITEKDFVQEKQVEINKADTMEQFDLQNNEAKEDACQAQDKADLKIEQNLLAEEDAIIKDSKPENLETGQKLLITTTEERSETILSDENKSIYKEAKEENQMKASLSKDKSQLQKSHTSTCTSQIFKNEGGENNTPSLDDINSNNQSEVLHSSTHLYEKNISDPQKMKKGQFNGLKRIDLLFNADKIKNDGKVSNKKKLNKLSLLNSRFDFVENVPEKNNISDKEVTCEKDSPEPSKQCSFNKLSLLNACQSGKFEPRNKINEQNIVATSCNSHITSNNLDLQNRSNTSDKKSNKNRLSLRNSKPDFRSLKSSLEIPNANDSSFKEHLKKQEKSSLANNSEKESTGQRLGIFSYTNKIPLKNSGNVNVDKSKIKLSDEISVNLKSKIKNSGLGNKEVTFQVSKNEEPETEIETSTNNSEALLNLSSKTAPEKENPIHRNIFKNKEILSTPRSELGETSTALKSTTIEATEPKTKISAIPQHKTLSHTFLKRNTQELSYAGLKTFKKPPLYKNKFHLLTANKPNKVSFVKRNKPNKIMHKIKGEKDENYSTPPKTRDALPENLYSKLTSFSDSIRKKKLDLECTPSAQEPGNGNQNLYSTLYQILNAKSLKAWINYENEKNSEKNFRLNKDNWILPSTTTKKKQGTPAEISLKNEINPASTLYQNLALRKSSLKKIIELKNSAAKVGTRIMYKKTSKKNINNNLSEFNKNEKSVSDTNPFVREETTVTYNLYPSKKYNTFLLNKSYLAGDDDSFPNLLNKSESIKSSKSNVLFKNLSLISDENSSLKMPKVGTHVVFDNTPHNEYHKFNNFPSVHHFLK
ncbi:uncharacterized protein isoform X2 [Rhodnius prolixus]